MKKLPLILCPLLLLTSCREEEPRDDAPQVTAEAPAADAVSGGIAYSRCADICALGPRLSGSPAYEQQLRYLTEHLTSAGWSVRREPFSLSDGSRMTNLHAVFGAEAGVRPIIISCHIDTKRGIRDFIGADDGASAAALMTELARVLNSMPDIARSTELVFFDGEEAFGRRMSHTDGMYGSRYDVLRRGTQGMPRYQINLDMIGGRNKRIAVPVLDTAPELLELYAEAIEHLGLPQDRWTMYPGSYLDDHQPFVEAGTASLNLIADFSEGGWWHTRRDDMSRLSAASFAETGRVVLYLLRHLAAQCDKAKVK